MKTWHLVAGTAVVAGGVLGWQLLGGIRPEPPLPGNEPTDEPPTSSHMLAGPGFVLRGSDPTPQTALRLVFDASGGRSRACAFGIGGGRQHPLGGGTCFDLPAGAGGELAQADDSALGAVISNDELQSLDGTMIHPGPAREAFVRAADAIVRVRGQEYDSLAVVSDGAVSGTTAVTLPDGARVANLVRDAWLVAIPNGEEGDRLQATLAGSGEPPVDIGVGPAEVERFRGCATGEALAVVAESGLVHSRRPFAVTFRTDDGWTAPVLSETSLYATQLACRGAELTLTWAETTRDADVDHHVVHQIRCTPTQCQHAEARAQLTGTDVMVADLAGKVLLVWATERGTRGRLAPLTDIDGGVAFELPTPTAPTLSRHLLPRPGAALVLLRTADGITGHRIDPNGTVTEVEPASSPTAPTPP